MANAVAEESDATAGNADTPYLDGDVLGAGWLNGNTDHDGRLEDSLNWQFSNGRTRGVFLARAGKAVQILPASIQPDVYDAYRGGAPAVRRPQLYSAVKYLDDVYFNDHFPRSLQIESILDNAALTTAGSPATLGNLVAAAAINSALNLVFTSAGGRGRQIVTALFEEDRKKATVSFRFLSKPIYTAASPILQLEAAPIAREAVIAVRTASTVVYVKASPSVGRGATTTSSEEITMSSQYFEIDPTAFGTARPVDICFDPFNSRKGRSLIADSHGGLWQTYGPDGMFRASSVRCRSIYSGLQPLRAGVSDDGRTPFARVAYGNHDAVAVVAREDMVRAFDLRSPDADTTLFCLPNGKSRILDMAKPPATEPEMLQRMLCTSEEVLLIDVRKPGQALLRYRHHIDADPSLSLSAMCENGVYRAVLWSRSKAVRTVYTFDNSASGRLTGAPYTLERYGNEQSARGFAFLRTTSASTKQGRTVSPRFVIDSDLDGSVYAQQLLCESEGHSEILRLLAPPKIGSHQFARPGVLDDTHPQEARKYKTADFRNLYTETFSALAGLHVADPGRKGAHDDSDALANAAFQTALEVVDRAGTDASDFSSEETFRSFTDASGLDRATVALDSVGEDLISLSEAYSTSVACTVPSTIIDPIYRRNPVQAAAILQERYGLNARPLKNKPDTVKRSLAFACEQLAVDLAMSSIAISDRLSSRIRAGSVVDTAPSAGLAILPPTVEYHFFRPSGKSTVASTGTEAARALLSEWTLGADPRVRPPYVDPYKRSEQTHEVHQRTSNPFRDRITKGGQISASQPAPRAFAASAISVNRSPIIPTATILPSDVRDDRREAQPPSQGRSTPPVRALPPQSVSSSQPLLLTSPVPSTQVVTGRHGGRPAKKKKRMGGF